MNHLRYIGKCECSCSIWAFGCNKVGDIVVSAWRDSERFRAGICRVVRFKVER